MEKGLNLDLVHSGEQYHVQTEDWGKENPFVVTRVYRHGRVIKSVKTHYTDLIPKAGYRAALGDTSLLSRVVQSALLTQHQTILDQLISGRLF